MSRKKQSKVNHVYIHIPFCKKKCPYCDFFSLPSEGQKIKDKYTDAIIKEFHHLSNKLAKPLKSIYLGGGSPALIGKKNLNKLLKAINPYLSKQTEKSIELNPEHLESSSVLNLSFNRISIGVQTTNKKLLKLIKRKYLMSKLIKNISMIKRKNISLSLDFMFGLPQQKMSDLKRDLLFIKKVSPGHISFYMFTPPDRYPLKHDIPDDKTIASMFKLIHSELKKFGFIHYEVSNFAKNKRICKHNFAYWDHSSYFGMGAGAHSFLSDKKERLWHGKNAKAYINNPLIYTGSEILDGKTEKLENVMLGLRLLNVGLLKSQIKINKITDLVKNDLVIVENNHIKINPDKLMLLDSIVEHICINALA